MTEEFNKEVELIMNGEKHLSYSSLKAFMHSPRHFFRYKTEKKETKAMNEGTILHKAVLEPDKFDNEYWFLDDTKKVEVLIESGSLKPRGTKLYKEYVAAEAEKNKGKEMLSLDFYNYCIDVRSYLNVNTATRDYISGLINCEKSHTFEYEGIKINAKIDGEGLDYTLDLKKVADASFKKIRWSIEDMMLDMQGGIYSFAVMKKKHILIFIDNDINVNVVELSPDTLKKGFAKFSNAIDHFKSCAEEDKFNYSYEFFNNGFTII